MKKVRLFLTSSIILFLGITFIGCEKEDGTGEETGENIPTITVNPGGDDGDVTGNGGTTTNSHTWTNNQSRAELNMDLTSAGGGSFQVVVTDDAGVTVLDETLTVGVGDDSRTRCSSSGESGTWTVTITLTDFNGDGSFTLSQGC